MNLSVVILTKNEEDNISEVIKSVSFANEVIIVDDESTDETIKYARKLGAKIISRKLDGDFSEQRNFAMSKAACKWILYLDADERVSQELAEEMMQITNNSFVHAEGFFIKRKDYFMGKMLNHGEVRRVKLVRLVRAGSGKWRRKVHEILGVSGRVKTLKYPLYHYPHRTLKEFLTDINWYSTLHAQSNRQEGKKSNLTKILIWPIGHFIANFAFRLGFLDGTRGLVFAIFMSFHSFLGWGKLWVSQKTNF